MPLADDALAEHGGRDGDARSLGELQQLVLQPEAMHLDAGNDHRPPAGLDAADGLGDGFGQNFGVAGRRFAGGRVRAVGHQAHHVARQFDVARPPMANHGRQHAVDLAQGRVRIVQFGLGAANAAEHLGLGVKILHPVVQQRIVEAFAEPRRTADDHHRRFLGIRPGNRIAEAQPAHAVRHAHRPDAVQAGVGVGGKAGAILPRATDQVDRAALQHRIEGQHVVAGDAEDVAHPIILQPADEIIADRDAPDGRLGGLALG